MHQENISNKVLDDGMSDVDEHRFMYGDSRYRSGLDCESDND